MLRNFKLRQKVHARGFIPLLIGGIISISILIFALSYRPTAPKANAPPSAPPLVPDAAMPYLGRADAPITVIELADPLCPGQKSFFDYVEPELKNKYIATGQVKLYEWPMVLNQQGTSFDSLEAMYCAKDQNKFWEYNDYLLKQPRTGPWAEHTRSDYPKLAQSLGLDMNAFNSCFDGGTYRSWIKEKDAQRKALNIQMSPTLFINNKMVVGALKDEIDAAIDRVIIDNSK